MDTSSGAWGSGGGTTAYEKDGSNRWRCILTINRIMVKAWMETMVSTGWVRFGSNEGDETLRAAYEATILWKSFPWLARAIWNAGCWAHELSLVRRHRRANTDNDTARSNLSYTDWACRWRDARDMDRASGGARDRRVAAAAWRTAGRRRRHSSAVAWHAAQISSSEADSEQHKRHLSNKYDKESGFWGVGIRVSAMMVLLVATAGVFAARTV